MTNITSKKKIFKWPLIIITTVGLIIFVGQKLINQDNTQESQQSITASVERGTITSGISASGQIATANYLSVTTSVNGIVKKVYVKEGEKVIAGQKLMDVTLDSEGEKSRISSYSAYLKAVNSLNSAKNSIVSIETQLAQAEKAFKEEKERNNYQTSEERLSYLVAETDVTNAKNALAERKAEISTMQTSVNTAWMEYQTQSPTITAPTDGVIASVLAIEGSKIENSVSERSVQTVAAIKKEGTPIASLNVSEVDINSIKVGQKVKLTLTSLPDFEATGIVAGIDKVGTSTSGVTNYPVTVKFDTSSDLILPNMSVEAEIILEEKQDVAYVPISAVQQNNNESIVKVVRNGATEEVKVQTGISDTDNIEIVSGLNEGETVVVSTLPTSGFTESGEQSRGSGGMGGFGGGGSVFIRR